MGGQLHTPKLSLKGGGVLGHCHYFCAFYYGAAFLRVLIQPEYSTHAILPELSLITVAKLFGLFFFNMKGHKFLFFLLDRLRFLLLYSVQEWGEDPPGLGQLVAPHEVHLASHEHVQDQALVCLR